MEIVKLEEKISNRLGRR